MGKRPVSARHRQAGGPEPPLSGARGLAAGGGGGAGAPERGLLPGAAEAAGGDFGPLSARRAGGAQRGPAEAGGGAGGAVHQKAPLVALGCGGAGGSDDRCGRCDAFSAPGPDGPAILRAGQFGGECHILGQPPDRLHHRPGGGGAEGPERPHRRLRHPTALRRPGGQHGRLLSAGGAKNLCPRNVGGFSGGQRGGDPGVSRPGGGERRVYRGGHLSSHGCDCPLRCLYRRGYPADPAAGPVRKSIPEQLPLGGHPLPGVRADDPSPVPGGDGGDTRELWAGGGGKQFGDF